MSQFNLHVLFLCVGLNRGWFCIVHYTRHSQKFFSKKDITFRTNRKKRFVRGTVNNPAKDAEGYRSPDSVLSVKLLINGFFINIEMVRVVKRMSRQRLLRYLF